MISIATTGDRATCSLLVLMKVRIVNPLECWFFYVFVGTAWTNVDLLMGSAVKPLLPSGSLSLV